MRVLFVVNSADSFKADVPTIFPDMQIVRKGRNPDAESGTLYQVASVRLVTSIGPSRSAQEEVEQIVAFVSPRGTTSVDYD
jgi:hypothetical protein